MTRPAAGRLTFSYDDRYRPVPHLDTTILTGLDQLPDAAVHAAVRAAQAIARANGNKGAARQLHIITADRDWFVSHHPTLTGIDADRTWGMFGVVATADSPSGYAYAIWLNPARTHAQQVVTLAHELAHLFSDNGHAHLWRRLYLMLLPVVAEMFGVRVKLELAAEQCVGQYYKPELSPNAALRQAAEIGGNYLTVRLNYMRYQEAQRLTKSAAAAIKRFLPHWKQPTAP